jgi:hypothetical protein
LLEHAVARPIGRQARSVGIVISHCKPSRSEEDDRIKECDGREEWFMSSQELIGKWAARSVKQDGACEMCPSLEEIS